MSAPTRASRQQRARAEEHASCDNDGERGVLSLLLQNLIVSATKVSPQRLGIATMRL
jgi:hypothetical protein